MGAAMIELSSTREALAALARGRVIEIEAYTLHGPVLHAAERAAQRGARVLVCLEGAPTNDRGARLKNENRRLAAELRSFGVRVKLEHPLHAKELRVDGERYLDGKNWHDGDVVLRDGDAAADAATISESKSAALAAEGDLLRETSAADDVVVESESFGCCNPVYAALQRLARTGLAPRLLVSAADLHKGNREWNALERLASDGVRVRVCNDSEKLAAAGNRAWLGSANASCAFGTYDMIDWGLTTNDATIARAARARLEATWRGARDFRPGATGA